MCQSSLRLVYHCVGGTGLVFLKSTKKCLSKKQWFCGGDQKTVFLFQLKISKSFFMESIECFAKLQPKTTSKQAIIKEEHKNLRKNIDFISVD